MLSVIIPVHNSERYLKQCIESIIGQSYKNMEIIIVENNSTDSSKKICNDYVKKDKRIRLLSESKKGAAAARNRGLSEAKGDYITFVDSDDWLDQKAYEVVMSSIEKENADIACYSFDYVDESGDKLNWYTPRLNKYKAKKPLEGFDIAKIFLTSKDIEGFCWNKVFRKSIFLQNRIRFEEEKTAYEDMAILFDAICCCQRAVVVPEKLYFYRQMNSSLTHLDYENKNEEYNDSVNHIIRTAKKYGLTKQTEIFIASREIYSLYDSVKCNGLSRNRYSCRQILKDALQIAKGYKSEKGKMIAKSMIILWNLLYEQKRGT